jgi:hypothetical protein
MVLGNLFPEMKDTLKVKAQGLGQMEKGHLSLYILIPDYPLDKLCLLKD